MSVKRSLFALCLLLAFAFVAAMVRSGKKLARLARENQKLIIQKDSLLSEKMDYENKFLQLLQQFDTVVRKNKLDSTVTFIPKNKKNRSPVSVKKSDVFN